MEKFIEVLKEKYDSILLKENEIKTEIEAYLNNNFKFKIPPKITVYQEVIMIDFKKENFEIESDYEKALDFLLKLSKKLFEEKKIIVPFTHLIDKKNKKEIIEKYKNF